MSDRDVRMGEGVGGVLPPLPPSWIFVGKFVWLVGKFERFVGKFV